MPQNLEAIGKCYFDLPPEQAGLGRHGDSDYRNYYGAYAMSVIAQKELHHSKHYGGEVPEIQLDMKRLGLSEAQLERNGLDFRGEGQVLFYTDTSDRGMKWAQFNHTQSGKRPDVPKEAIEPLERSVSDRLNLALPGHPDHALYQQALTGVHRLDAEHNRTPDAASERLAASLTLLARQEGLTRIAHVVFSRQTDTVQAGENVFVVQGRMDDPAQHRGHMKTQITVETPAAQSFKQRETLNQTLAEQQTLQRSLDQEQTQQQDALRHGMSR